MFLAAKEFPLPVEYRFLPLEEVFHEPPADVVGPRRSCSSTAATSTACRSTSCSATTRTILNIDHHHDNTRFGTVNLVDTEASCTAEIVFELAKLLGAEITPEIAAALYVALVTDTGRFMYENTGAGGAPDGGRADRGRGRRPRHLPPPLRARADREAPPDLAGDRADRAARRRPAGGHLHLGRAITPRPGADESLTEGIIDHVRALEGTEVAAMSATRRDDDRVGAQGQPALHRRPRRRLGDRPQARAAAGTPAPPASPPTSPTTELVEFLCAEVRRSSAARVSARRQRRPLGGVLLVDKPAGRHVPRRGRPGSPRARQQDRPRGHARPVRHRPADRAARPRGDARAALLHGAAEDLPGRRAVRRRVDHRAIPTARSPRPGVSAGAARAPHREIRQRPPAYSAVKVRRRARLPRARRGRRSRCRRASDRPPLRAAVAGRRPGRVRDRVLVRDLRPQPDRRSRRRLLRELGGRRSGPFGVEEAGSADGARAR